MWCKRRSIRLKILVTRPKIRRNCHNFQTRKQLNKVKPRLKPRTKKNMVEAMVELCQF